MSDGASETIKAISSQAANQQALSGKADPQVQAIQNALMLEDEMLLKILKGEFQDMISQLSQMMANFEAHYNLLLDHFMAQKQETNAAKLTLLTQQVLEVKKQIAEMAVQFKRYQRFMPYIMLFTSTSTLSNITRPEAQQIWRKIDIMISRDKIMAEDDDDMILSDTNLWDAIGIRAFLHVLRNVEGYTFKGLNQNRTTVESIITDHTKGNRKKILGVF